MQVALAPLVGVPFFVVGNNQNHSFHCKCWGPALLAFLWMLTLTHRWNYSQTLLSIIFVIKYYMQFLMSSHSFSSLKRGTLNFSFATCARGPILIFNNAYFTQSFVQMANFTSHVLEILNFATMVGLSIYTTLFCILAKNWSLVLIF
jgi:hypothetical protein